MWWLRLEHQTVWRGGSFEPHWHHVEPDKITPCINKILLKQLCTFSTMKILNLYFRTMVTSSFPRIESLEEEFLDTIEEPPIAQRMGIMTAFWSFEEFVRYMY